MNRRLLILFLAFSGGCSAKPATVRTVGGQDSADRFARPGGAAAVETPVRHAAVEPPGITEKTLTLAKSVEGRPILLHILGEGDEHILVLAGFHGNEPTGTQLANALLAYLRTNPGVCAGRQIGIAPTINPDGLARNQRTNANRVDVNRNFAASNWSRARDRETSRGSRPGSEPETQAVITAVHLIEPVRILSIHSITRGRHCTNYDGPAATLAQAMSATNGYPARPTMGYETPGSFGTWAGVDRRIPTITLELPRDATAEACWRDNREALLTFIAGR